LILGLGYEGGRGIAAIEEFEATSGWLFFSRGGHKEYETSVEKANELILRAPGDFFIVNYNVFEPVELIALFAKVVGEGAREGRPIIVPFGPKIFAFCSMLGAIRHPIETTVWRMSGGVADALTDRIATGQVLTLNIQFSSD